MQRNVYYFTDDASFIFTSSEYTSIPFRGSLAIEGNTFGKWTGVTFFSLLSLFIFYFFFPFFLFFSFLLFFLLFIPFCDSPFFFLLFVLKLPTLICVFYPSLSFSLLHRDISIYTISTYLYAFNL